MFKYTIHPSKPLLLLFFFITAQHLVASGQTQPDELKFVRQGVKRMIFDEDQSIPLAKLDPAKIVGLSSMHPATHTINSSSISIQKNKLVIGSKTTSETAIWFGGFNPFATYSIDLGSTKGEGEIGFEFSAPERKEQFFITVAFKNTALTGINLKVAKNSSVIANQSILVNRERPLKLQGKIILQMLGSGLVLYLKDKELPQVIAQSDFNTYMDLREKKRINSFQSHLYLNFKSGQVVLNGIDMALNAGVGLADIRAITYENGDPFFENGRLWYTASIRGRALPHHIQGVFSMNPSVFDIRMEGIILFDRNDGLLRNEIASHIFYDRKYDVWRGITTGFSAFANPKLEKKQLIAVESKKDPRFGFSVMSATPFGIVGDVEDPHILFDTEAKKWRILTCENQDGYKAIILESDNWNKGYKKIAGPVAHNSTGTSIQKIDGRYFCFSGSSEQKIFIYTYPDLKEAGTLKMDLPPWTSDSGSRVWPNLIQLPEGYPFKFIALMMDRFNYPGISGPNWTYGSLYLYHAE